jgi:hypothetical protein
MANSMQNITNEIFMDALPFIWVRVWNKLTKKSTRDKQPTTTYFQDIGSRTVDNEQQMRNICQFPLSK